MDSLKTIFNVLGKQYEVLVYEQARRKTVAAQRDVLKLGIEATPELDARLSRKIQLTEQILNDLVKLKELCD